MTNIGITGATGMIGTNLLALLTADERWRERCRPVALVRLESRTEALRELGVEMRVIDYRDPESFRGKVEDLEVLIHLAGLTKAYRRREFYEVNAAATRNLLEAAARYGSGIRHFLFSSSLAACGPAPSPDRPKDEEAQCSPESHYGRSKLEAEAMIRESSLDWTILRLPMVLGPHDYDGLRLFRLVRSGWVFTFGRQEDYFSYIFAQDLCGVILRMVLSPGLYREVLNVCYDGQVRGLEFYREVRRALGLDPALRLHHLPRWSAFAAGFTANLIQAVRGKASYVNLDKARDLTGKNMVMTNAKMKHKLGIEAFREGGALAETLQWFRDRGLL